MANKYNAKKAYSMLCMRTFDSQAERARGEELRLLEIAGEICYLRNQVLFILSKEPRVTITVDFVYWDHGQEIYEDTKGVVTREWRVKQAWAEAKFNIKIILIK